MNIAERLKRSREWATMLLYSAMWRDGWQDRRSDPEWQDLNDRAHASLRAEWMEYGDDLDGKTYEVPGAITLLNMINIRRTLESANITIQPN